MSSYVKGTFAGRVLYARFIGREYLRVSTAFYYYRAAEFKESSEDISHDEVWELITADQGPEFSESGTKKDRFGFLRQGHRWLQLVDLFGSREILLIDGSHSVCLCRSRGSNDRETYSEFGHVTTLDCCPKGVPSLGIDKIMESGTDEVFEKLTEFLLAPELQLQVTCQRMSGLVSQLHRFYECTDEELASSYRSLLSEVRSFFIEDHFDCLAFNQVPWLGELLNEAEPSGRGYSSSAIKRLIDDAFGSDHSSTHVESSGMGVWGRFRNGTDGDKDDNGDKADEGNDEDDGDDGDDVDDSPDEVYGRDQEDLDATFDGDTGFDNDFCILLQDSDLIASLESSPYRLSITKG
ncbi:hypothetical protein A1O3_04456 [Capronia epimyces CBS 606.96]|uniref:Uncharacterized protein n=1 Tax=Capronia epimyces CBS 606.96 TaxID=1182542 RepID=W9YE08_9EURO|nr:uncharacterized protein A1O3_04456 [Capronia epimyces CBS 606.96]EXJ87496.1 hypothetical protein A1O3_04456 [Capronia epimyces CBS 606.96]